jgi:hypothetical protein
MLVGVNSRTYYKSSGLSTICVCGGGWEKTQTNADCHAWANIIKGYNENLEGEMFIHDNNIFNKCRFLGGPQSGSPIHNVACICKMKCNDNQYLKDGYCSEPCTGVIEAAYTDENKLDSTGFPTYVSEKCVTKEKLKERYNELVCRL